MAEGIFKESQSARELMLEQIRDGMTVVDAAGEQVGSVEYFRLADPDAISSEREADRLPGLVGDVAVALGAKRLEPDLDEPLRTRLLRKGFVKIDDSRLLHHDRYVELDHVVDVSGDSVNLGITRDQLIGNG